MKNTRKKHSPEVAEMIAQIKRLTERNKRITESGGFFTALQIKNEQEAWMLKMCLRSDYGMELGTY